MDAWWQDLRFGARLLARNRGASAAAILALVLGIGACTAVFSVVHGVLLRPLPYPRSERLVALAEISPRGQRMSFSDPNFEDVRDGSRSFEALAQYSASVESVAGGLEPLRAGVAAVSERFFDVFATRPARGRAFGPEESAPGAAPTAIVSHAFWRRSLGGTPDLASTPLRIEGHDVTVIGVMPAAFAFPPATDVWVPRALYPRLPSRTAHNWKVAGRLREGVGVEGARRELTGIAHRLKARYGEDTWMSDVAVVPLRESLTGSARPALLVLSSAVGFLLLVACANVTSLLLAQAATRQRGARREDGGGSRARPARPTAPHRGAGPLPDRGHGRRAARRRRSEGPPRLRARPSPSGAGCRPEPARAPLLGHPVPRRRPRARPRDGPARHAPRLRHGAPRR